MISRETFLVFRKEGDKSVVVFLKCHNRLLIEYATEINLTIICSFLF